MNQLFELLSWACAIASLAAFAYKLPKLRVSTQSATLFALCIYFLFNAVAYWADLEILRGRLVRAFDYPNITVIIVQASVVVLTAAQQVSIVYMILPPAKARRAARRQIIGFGIALAVLIALFAAIHPSKALHPGDRLSEHQGQKLRPLHVVLPSYMRHRAVPDGPVLIPVRPHDPGLLATSGDVLRSWRVRAHSRVLRRPLLADPGPAH